MGSAPEQELRVQVRRMADQLVHRGPDDSGVGVDAEAGIALGFRRLAIVDLLALLAIGLNGRRDRILLEERGN